MTNEERKWKFIDLMIGYDEDPKSYRSNFERKALYDKVVQLFDEGVKNG